MREASGVFSAKSCDCGAVWYNGVWLEMEKECVRERWVSRGGGGLVIIQFVIMKYG